MWLEFEACAKVNKTQGFGGSVEKTNHHIKRENKFKKLPATRHENVIQLIVEIARFSNFKKEELR